MNKPIQKESWETKLGMTQFFDKPGWRLPWYRRAPVWFEKTGKRMVMMRYRSVSGGQGEKTLTNH